MNRVFITAGEVLRSRAVDIVAGDCVLIFDQEDKLEQAFPVVRIDLRKYCTVLTTENGGELYCPRESHVNLVPRSRWHRSNGASA
jgi:hypothetical protein